MTVTFRGKTTLVSTLSLRVDKGEITPKLGDTIEATVRHPVPGTIKMTLVSPDSCAYAKKLLLEKSSSWNLQPSPK